jgi:hypothetical protein
MEDNLPSVSSFLKKQIMAPPQLHLNKILCQMIDKLPNLIARKQKTTTIKEGIQE